jgi:N6-adenosine-specific RNA methylase IME4
MSEPWLKGLVRYNKARQALAAASRIDEVKSIRDYAIAAQTYARQAKDKELIEPATEIRTRAEIKAGEMLIALAKVKQRHSGRAHKIGKKVVGSQGEIPQLADLGIDRNQSSRWQKLALLSPAKQEALIRERVRSAIATAEGDTAIVKEARKRQQTEKRTRRAVREQELATKIQALPDERFGAIYADPEWRDEQVWSEETGMDRAADNHYPTSDATAIAARDVQAIAADDCVLFLWTTNQHLLIALGVMKEWGFDYKSNYCWGKDRVGMGRWNRSKHELLLIGTRGKVPAPAPGTQRESLIMAPKGRHSAKPEVFLEMVESYYPNVPKIELNRRGKPRPGWSAWGNEAELPEAAE